MAQKGSSGGGFALIIVALVVGAIANYWRELLILGGIVLAVWVAYKVFQPKQPEQSAPSPSPTPAPPRPAVTAFIGNASRVPSGPVTSRNGDEYWVSPLRSVAVSGRPIGGGVYVGVGLGAIAGPELEPALIDRKLPVDRSLSNCSVRQLGYWPSYQGASPTARAAYLDWLGSGRSRPDADLGYVFLYFYGLERRALHDARISEAAKADLPWIETELERLLGIYWHSGSFQSYAGSLLDLLRHQVVSPRLYLEQPGPVQQYRGLGLGHRVALAQCAADGSPLPAAWAYTWFYSDPTTRLKTAAVRCPDEFKRLFSKRYAEVFGSGMVLPKNKTRLKLERRPASQSFQFGGQGHVLQFDLPDVSVLTSPVKKLQDIAEWCFPKLDSYSRFVRKDGVSKDSFDAILELPLALWPEHSRQVIDKMRATVSEAQRPAAIPFKKFKSWFPEWQSVTKTKLQSLYRVLAEAGLGMEPDIRFGGTVPDPNSNVVLFADDAASSSTTPSARYTAGALTLQLGAAVALADGNPNDAEKGVMSRQLEEWLHLSESERRRLHAFTRLVFSAPPKLNGIKAKVDALDLSQRQAIGDFLAVIAQSDSVVTPAEIKTLEKSYRLLGLDPQRVYSNVHVAATEPVTVRSAAESEGFAIPKPRATARAGISLDQNRIAELQKDTERVSAILGSIFASESVEPEMPATAEEEEPSLAQEVTLLGLTAAQSAFVKTLLTRPHWTRAELEELAQDRDFMLDGMVERINDASFEKYEKPLLEGEDPVDLNEEVVRELVQ
jgi:uncharacterized tellurite resistance protein B-like protein